MNALIPALLAFSQLTVAPLQSAPPTEVKAPAVTAEQKQEVLDRMTRIITTNAFAGGADFSKLPELLEQRREILDKATTPQQFVSAVNGVLTGFGFSHVMLITPEAARMRRERRMVGLGIRIQVEERGIRIEYVFPGSPAEDAGLKPQDLILEADGVKPTGPGSLGGTAGSEVKIKVESPNGDTRELTVKRREFSTAMPETLVWPEEKTALLTVPTFDLAYNRERVDQLMGEAAKADNLIVDLRMNGGGAVLNLMHLCQHFFEGGTAIGTFLGRTVVDRYKEETKITDIDLVKVAEWARDKVRVSNRSTVKPFGGRIVVLISGGTGSASEMFAAAARELREAPLVGSKSAGAVLASFMSPLPHGYVLQYPITDYITIKGRRLEGNGLEPDVEASAPVSGRPDEGVRAALEWLRRAK